MGPHLYDYSCPWSYLSNPAVISMVLLASTLTLFFIYTVSLALKSSDCCIFSILLPVSVAGIVTNAPLSTHPLPLYIPGAWLFPAERNGDTTQV
jgi:hypothetical protein